MAADMLRTSLHVSSGDAAITHIDLGSSKQLSYFRFLANASRSLVITTVIIFSELVTTE